MKPYTPDIDPHVIPGLEFRPELRTEGQKQLGIPADKLHKVLRKIVRGSEYWLAQGRIIEDHSIYQRSLHEQDLTGLAELCANVARNLSADSQQSDTAHALHVEWTRLRLDGSLDHGATEAEKSLRKRMLEFLAEIPSWMSSGL
jgi:hypothetical protein